MPLHVFYMSPPRGGISRLPLAWLSILRPSLFFVLPLAVDTAGCDSFCLRASAEDDVRLVKAMIPLATMNWENYGQR